MRFVVLSLYSFSLQMCGSKKMIGVCLRFRYQSESFACSVLPVVRFILVWNCERVKMTESFSTANDYKSV